MINNIVGFYIKLIKKKKVDIAYTKRLKTKLCECFDEIIRVRTFDPIHTYVDSMILSRY